ncbi:hypothetical protein SAMN03159406_04127 [Rhizobium sp. NFR03]|nr:hypothetical protein SAMN03159406_04127 [Rhizobium sp. NFR03]
MRITGYGGSLGSTFAKPCGHLGESGIKRIVWNVEFDQARLDGRPGKALVVFQDDLFPTFSKPFNFCVDIGNL